MLDTPRMIYSVQRRDTNQFWCADSWSTTPQWVDHARVDEICRKWRELPLSLSSRRVVEPSDNDVAEPPLRRCEDCRLDLTRDVLRALGSCPRWGTNRAGVESRCPAFVAKAGAQ